MSYVPPITDTSANGALTTNGTFVTLTGLKSANVVTAQVSGSYTGTLVPQVSNDGTNWTSLAGGKQWLERDNGSYQDNITAAVGVFQINISGWANFRLGFTSVPSGTATIYLNASAAAGGVVINQPLPASGNQIGNVGQGGTWSITQSGTWTVQPGNTANTTAWLTNPLTPAVSTTGDTGAKTATFNGATQTNATSKGATVILNIGTVSGTTPTLVAILQGSADSGTTWFNIPGATTASLTATGVYGIQVYPGLATTAGSTTTGTTATASALLPRSWRVQYTIGGTTPSFTLTNVQVSYAI